MADTMKIEWNKDAHEMVVAGTNFVVDDHEKIIVGVYEKFMYPTYRSGIRKMLSVEEYSRCQENGWPVASFNDITDNLLGNIYGLWYIAGTNFVVDCPETKVVIGILNYNKAIRKVLNDEEYTACQQYGWEVAEDSRPSSPMVKSASKK